MALKEAVEDEAAITLYTLTATLFLDNHCFQHVRVIGNNKHKVNKFIDNATTKIGCDVFKTNKQKEALLAKEDQFENTMNGMGAKKSTKSTRDCIERTQHLIGVISSVVIAC